MSIELSVMTAITHRLPPVRGSMRLAYSLARFYNRKPRPPVVSKVRGSEMELDPREYVDQSLLFCPNLYDRWEFQQLAEYLKPGQMAVDLGAHIGTYSLALARLVGPSGHVMAFEAWPETYAKLVNNIDRNGLRNVIAKNIGLSDVNGTVPFYLNESGNAGGNSMTLKDGDVIRTKREIYCTTLLDAIGNGLDRIDFMKIDIENMEYRVLGEFFRTADNALYPRAILTECITQQASLAGGNLESLLTANNYRRAAEKSQKGERNLVFVRD